MRRPITRRTPPAQAGRVEESGETGEFAILGRLWPYLLPKGDWEAKWRMGVAMAFLIAGKVALVATPLFLAQTVDALAPAREDGSLPGEALLWIPLALVAAYGFSRLLGASLGDICHAIFSKVSERAMRLIAVDCFRHVHNLSIRYHLNRKTGALQRILERGAMAVSFILRFLVFNLGPLALEIALVSAVFFARFDAFFVLIILGTMAAYTVFTFKVTEWRLQIRKVMNEQDQDAAQKSVDSLLNYETVKVFTAESREIARYDTAMAGYQESSIRTQVSLAWLNIGQAAIITVGLVTIMALTAAQVARGDAPVGDFVLVNAYVLQLTRPLSFLGTIYRNIRQSLVDMQAMFTLLDQVPEVRDAPDAKPLAVTEGRVQFEDVRFSYDPEREILKGLSFDLPGGQSLAIVGASGAGKSTVSRLLFRFYDVSAGRITIDGQDLRAVTQTSLRFQIGVVPQDTVLFNDTIRYNIAYGRDEATQTEVEAAAKLAQIHDFIIGLPDGYDTLVGERGLKLSGGEKQRVAMARAVLKDPPILLLDEATSALDSATEREIQASLRRLSRDRTVITIAHRLSTVVEADEILVMADGQVIERGVHADLLALGGRYAEMWARQEASEETGAGSVEAAAPA